MGHFATNHRRCTTHPGSHASLSGSLSEERGAFSQCFPASFFVAEMSRALHEEETTALLSVWDQNPAAKPISRFANTLFPLGILFVGAFVKQLF